VPKKGGPARKKPPPKKGAREQKKKKLFKEERVWRVKDDRRVPFRTRTETRRQKKKKRNTSLTTYYGTEGVKDYAVNPPYTGGPGAKTRFL